MSTKLSLLFVVAGMCLVGYSLYDYDPPVREPIEWPEPLKPEPIVEAPPETQPEKPIEPIVEPLAPEIPSVENRSTDESDTAATCVGTPDSSSGLQRVAPTRRRWFRRFWR